MSYFKLIVLLGGLYPPRILTLVTSMSTNMYIFYTYEIVSRNNAIAATSNSR